MTEIVLELTHPNTIITMSSITRDEMSDSQNPFRAGAEGNALRNFQDAMQAKRDREIGSQDSTIFLADLQRANLAHEFEKRIIAAIRRFESALDIEQEVGVRLVTFGQSVTIHVDTVHCWNPSLIVFRGTSEGRPIELIQHITQLSFLLIAMPKPDPTAPARRFGFGPPDADQAG